MSTNPYLTLFILRHGKASDHANTDFDRPLTKKGQQQAAEKGLILKQKLPFINTIFCSSALRTRETLQYSNLDHDQSHIFIQKELYLCKPEVLLAHINQIDHGKSALLIGHNPGLHQFAYNLLPLYSKTRTPQEDALSASFPKCALAEFQFSCSDWSQINWHQGSLISFDR
ncbi:histidine phosphatase family protein [Commensalibacter papalotli (ex Botero et al. 2024)]|uniref:Phosphohistidine phosphatase SixA (SixA) (PDB:1UJB) n=1 Tax=Commensalibacter papalotli (ex Botero et al. 2024) TaxID=2972766 RepID=A0ABM9HMQ0_9PROT|nr:histidine phosphatase family protein [Commensalibacter papalotli (ex Botero et al. 2024)]CAI3936838.1 Phosphohistidine phosphatase SixA (SixA) (PDB:1UJB) [Commensalibacter papalotli (ex Botero et al. 2024)]CAI3938844.1 Phosphohistidine phosphatase SixA (SixA) (PDB:1UJB) [Commensalibacter papalotli (ex Botero et al. 2024)]